MSVNPLRIIVIGGGVGGYTAALRAASAGCQVTLVEKAFIGGTCLNVGCIPTKALLESARIARLAQRGVEFGITLEVTNVDLGVAVVRSRRVVEVLRRGVEDLLSARGVEVIRGTGYVRGGGKVEITSEQGNRLLEADYVVIATGSSWMDIGGIEPDGSQVITSDHALFQEQIPTSMVIVGAGAVGCEFAEIYSAFGARVTLIEMMDHILPGEDKELARRLETVLKRKGIKVMTSTRVRAITRGATDVVVETDDGSKLEAAQVLMAVGRKPNITGIGIDEAGIASCPKGIVTDATMRTNVEGVYAVGDVTGNSMLAHVAMRQAIVAVENITGNEAVIDYGLVPRCVYTDPEYAAVGKTEAQAREEGYDVKVTRVRLGHIGRALTMGEAFGLAKVVADANTKRLLGMQILAPHASEFITEATVALKQGGRIETMADVIHPHPTLSEMVWESFQAALGRSIHGD